MKTAEIKNENIKKTIVFWLCFIFVLCVLNFNYLKKFIPDYVNISRYPEGIQNCYNQINYLDLSCGNRKRTIVKYCECLQSVQDLIENKRYEIYTEASVLATSVGGHWTPDSYYSSTIGPKVMTFEGASGKLDGYIRRLHRKCAEKTGYIECD